MQPDDERARIRETERGAQARLILEHPLWDEAYTVLANAYLERVINAATDEETLEAKRNVLALNSVKKHLAQIMQTGQLAERQLEEHRDGRSPSNARA